MCLTATEVSADAFAADVMHESLRRSSLGQAAQEGARVNLELSLRASDRLGGHIVQGHVDGVGTVSGVARGRLQQGRDDRRARPTCCATSWRRARSRSNGVSLTVCAISDEAFEVSLIPETLERTTLGQAAPGAVVNLEVDVLAKYVEKLVAR